MGKIKEINLLTTDGNWWKLCDDVNSTMDETIVNKLLAQMSVKARKWFDADNAPSFTGNLMHINTSNIIAIEVIIEREG